MSSYERILELDQIGDMTITPNIEKEIVELHQFFEDSHNGRLPKSMETMDRYASVTVPDFYVATVDGRIVPREECIAGVLGRNGTLAGLRMWIEKVVVRQQQGDIFIATYQEWGQEVSGRRTMFTSTAVFQRDDSKPNGVVWLLIHESGLKEFDN